MLDGVVCQQAYKKQDLILDKTSGSRWQIPRFLQQLSCS
jgi:hypothetical protein